MALSAGVGAAWLLGQVLDPILVDPKNALPSEATFHAVDIGLRVRYFYWRIGAFLLVFFITYMLFGAWLRKAGKVLWIRRLLQISIAALAIWSGLTLVYENPNHYPAATWWWLSGLAALLAVGAVWRKGWMHNWSLPLLGLVGAVMGLLILYQGSIVGLGWSVLAFVAVGSLCRFGPLAWLAFSLSPAAALLSVEIGKLAWLPTWDLWHVPVMALGLLAMAFAIKLSLSFGLLRHGHRAFWKYILTATVGSLGAMVYSEAGYIDYYEMFENANPANAYMRVLAHGEWPMLQFLSAHLLSEQLPAYLHYALFGYSEEPVFLRYAHLWLSFAPLVGYLFLSRIFGSPTWSFLLVLFFPFFPFLFPASYFYAIVSAFLLFYWLKGQVSPGLAPLAIWWSWKCFGIVIWLAFLVFWRIDLAAAILPAVWLLVLLGYAAGFVPRERVFQLISASLVLGFVGLLAFLAANGIFQGQLTDRVAMAMAYFGASQAHGYADIQGRWDALFFDLHYHWMPLLVAAVAIGLVWCARRHRHRKPDFLVMSALFLAFFYFFNAPRGLVRHGLVEGSDVAIGSFAALVVILGILRLIPRLFYPMATVGLMSICVLMAKIGQGQQAVPLLSQTLARVPSYLGPPVEYTLSSIGAKRKSRIDSVVQYLDDQLDSHETFIDFSNSPMLYFYAQRKVPSYFNQSLQNLPTLEGQLLALPYFDYHAMPVVTYRHSPESWWDHTDGVPNAIRYPLIAQFLFQHYLPYDTIGGYEIWLAKERLPDSTAFGAISPQSCDLMWYPYFIGQKRGKELVGTGKLIELASKIKAPARRDVVGVQVRAGKANDWLELEYFSSGVKSGSIRFNLNSADGNYLVPIWTQPNWWLAPADSLVMVGPGKERVGNVVLYRHADQYPDLD